MYHLQSKNQSYFFQEFMYSPTFKKQSPSTWQQATSTTSLNAPLQHPQQQHEIPPEIFLEGSQLPERVSGSYCHMTASRRKSMDQPYSIIGYMNRKISDKRGRIYSQNFLEGERRDQN